MSDVVSGEVVRPYTGVILKPAWGGFIEPATTPWPPLRLAAAGRFRMLSEDELTAAVISVEELDLADSAGPCCLKLMGHTESSEDWFFGVDGAEG